MFFYISFSFNLHWKKSSYQFFENDYDGLMITSFGGRRSLRGCEDSEHRDDVLSMSGGERSESRVP